MREARLDSLDPMFSALTALSSSQIGYGSCGRCGGHIGSCSSGGGGCQEGKVYMAVQWVRDRQPAIKETMSRF
jgi:hypothetical protein